MDTPDFNLTTTLGDFIEAQKERRERLYLVARCDECDHGRRLDLEVVIDDYGETMNIGTLERELACPNCGVRGGQRVGVFVFGS